MAHNTSTPQMLWYSQRDQAWHAANNSGTGSRDAEELSARNAVLEEILTRQGQELSQVHIKNGELEQRIQHQKGIIQNLQKNDANKQQQDIVDLLDHNTILKHEIGRQQRSIERLKKKNLAEKEAIDRAMVAMAKHEQENPDSQGECW